MPAPQSVLCELLELLISAPKAFWSNQVAASEADSLAQSLFDGLIKDSENNDLEELDFEEKRVAEWTAQLCARIDRAQKGTGWTIGSRPMKSFCALAVFVPGVRTALRKRITVRD